ncbi:MULTISPECIES: hypothetical protein [Actinomycetes]|nr:MULTISPECIES: hypothetical protein [Actinomycetes]
MSSRLEVERLSAALPADQRGVLIMRDIQACRGKPSRGQCRLPREVS